VLVVDDNPVNLMVISAQIESLGLVAWSAADGAQAVALARDMSFDLILMDLQMPILDGLDASVAIRQLENACARPAVPILAYSSLFPPASMLASHGMTGSLAKPCDVRELEACLLRWCPTYRAAPAARDVPSYNSRWQAARRNPRASEAALR
jgi:two-component system sensor histidine kinase BarA